MTEYQDLLEKLATVTERVDNVKKDTTGIASKLDDFVTKCGSHLQTTAVLEQRVKVLESSSNDAPKILSQERSYRLERSSLAISVIAIIVLSIFNLISIFH